MNNAGELAQVHGLNVVATLVEVAVLVLCILKYKYNGIKLLKIAFYSMVVAETFLMCFMNYGAFQIAVACILSIVLLPELIIYISKYPSKRTKLLKWAFLFMFIGGMILYFYCNYRGLELAISDSLKDNTLEWAKNASWFYKFFYVVISSVMDVGWMFQGRGNVGAFFRLPEAKDPLFVFVFWFLHIVAFLTAVSALLIRFGDNLLRWVRTKTQVSCVDLVFGINADSLAFSRNIANTGNNMLVYVDSVVSEDYEATIQNLGGLIYSNADALKATASFLKEIYIGKKNMRLRLYALSHDYDKNIQYARMMSATLEKEGIPPEQTELVLLGTDEEKGMLFQFSKKQYGYGSVVSFDEYEMSARLLINKYPLCNFINFDENGRTNEDIEVLIGGFGRIGHEVLRKVLANGRFEGSKLTIRIFDPKHGDRTGFAKSQYPLMFAPPSHSNIDIGFEAHDVRSDECFDFLKEHASKLKYIVICLEDRENARNIAIRMADRLHAIGHPRNVYTCDSKGIRCYSHSAQECEEYSIYDSDILCSDELDRYAMELHHYYSKEKGNSLAEDWKQCGYFHRMSSRASVDYLIPLLRKITAMNNADTLTPEQKENLAKCEHLRWCAFHYTFGYDVMGIEEFIERLKKQQAEIQEQGKSGITPRQAPEARKHVCLVSWDKLDDISQAENSVTHGHRDFKQNDRDNIDVIMELIQQD